VNVLALDLALNDACWDGPGRDGVVRGRRSSPRPLASATPLPNARQFAIGLAPFTHGR
jgi:hypothetical protein